MFWGVGGWRGAGGQKARRDTSRSSHNQLQRVPDREILERARHLYSVAAGKTPASDDSFGGGFWPTELSLLVAACICTATTGDDARGDDARGNDARGDDARGVEELSSDLGERSDWWLEVYKPTPSQ